MRFTLFMALLLGLAACGHSPPTHFYTVDPSPPGQPARRAFSGPVNVADVNLPAMLDRRAVVLRSGANQVEVSDQARWAAPLDGMVRRTMAEDLAERLGHENVLMPGDPLPSGTVYTVVLTLTEFGASKDGSAILSGDWAVRDNHQQVLLMRHVRLSQSVPANDIGAVASALSSMLGKVSDDVAAALSTSNRTGFHQRK
jgi:uncharacterized protein